MHAFVSGRPSRVLLLERMIEHSNSSEGVWWATLEEITAWCLAAGKLETWTAPDLETLAGH